MSRNGFSEGFSASISQEKKSKGSTPNFVHSLGWSVCLLVSGPNASCKILFIFSTDGDGWERDCTRVPSFCGSSFYNTEKLDFCFNKFHILLTSCLSLSELPFFSGRLSTWSQGSFDAHVGDALLSSFLYQESSFCYNGKQSLIFCTCLLSVLPVFCSRSGLTCPYLDSIRWSLFELFWCFSSELIVEIIY